MSFGVFLDYPFFLFSQFQQSRLSLSMAEKKCSITPCRREREWLVTSGVDTSEMIWLALSIAWVARSDKLIRHRHVTDKRANCSASTTGGSITQQVSNILDINWRELIRQGFHLPHTALVKKINKIYSKFSTWRNPSSLTINRALA